MRNKKEDINKVMWKCKECRMTYQFELELIIMDKEIQCPNPVCRCIQNNVYYNSNKINEDIE